jgi:hypothetical protein
MSANHQQPLAGVLEISMEDGVLRPATSGDLAKRLENRLGSILCRSRNAGGAKRIRDVRTFVCPECKTVWSFAVVI